MIFNAKRWIRGANAETLFQELRLSAHQRHVLRGKTGARSVALGLATIDAQEKADTSKGSPCEFSAVDLQEALQKR